MKTIFLTLLALPLILPAFGVGVAVDAFPGFTMDFVDITGGTNADSHGATDGTGPYGALPYDYRMGKHEVSRAMIEAYNANSGGPAIDMADMTLFGGNGANRPATGVSWNAAARFVNWLNVSAGHAPAYKFAGILDANENITLWAPGDAGYDPDNLFRNSNAFYFLPSEDEWYRAAYYDPTAGVYWDYATGSDSAPTAVSGGTAAGTAVYGGEGGGPADVTNAGGLSPFGTMGQNGNVWERIESGFNAPNDSADEVRVVRGSFQDGSSVGLQSSWRSDDLFGPSIGVFENIGFRVASVPEPSAMLLTLLGGVCVLLRRRW